MLDLNFLLGWWAETQLPFSPREAKNPAANSRKTHMNELCTISGGPIELAGDIGGGSDLDIYRVGNSSRCIVWNYHLFGFGGRTRELADLISRKGILMSSYRKKH